MQLAFAGLLRNDADSTNQDLPAKPLLPTTPIAFFRQLLTFGHGA
jgi:hypothetical protein